MASYSWPSTLNATVFRRWRLVRRTGADSPSTSTDVPVISCEATDFKSSASSIGNYPGWNSSYRLCGEVIPARHLTPGIAKFDLRLSLAISVALRLPVPVRQYWIIHRSNVAWGGQQ